MKAGLGGAQSLTFGFGSGAITLDNGRLFLRNFPSAGGANQTTFSNGIVVAGGGGTITTSRNSGEDVNWRLTGPITVGGTATFVQAHPNATTLAGSMLISGGDRTMRFTIQSGATTITGPLNEDVPGRTLTIACGPGSSAFQVLVMSGTNNVSHLVLGEAANNNLRVMFGISNALPLVSLKIAEGGYAGIDYNPGSQAALDALIAKLTTDSTGILGLDWGNTALNLNLSTNDVRIGTRDSLTYTGTITPFNDSIYRVGGGGGTLTFSVANTFTGARDLDIGTSGGIVTGTVVISAANDISGQGTLSAGTLILSAANAVGTTPFAFTNGASLILNASLAHTNSALTAVSTGGLSNLTLNAADAIGNQMLLTINSGVLTLGAVNAYTNRLLTVQGGLVSINASNAVTGPLVFNGGTISINATNGYAGSSNITVPTNGTLITTVNGGNPFGSGQVSVFGTLTGVGMNGTFHGVTNFTLLPGSTLYFDNSSATASNWNRWADDRPIALNSSTLRLMTQGDKPIIETVGDVSFAGGSTLFLGATGGGGGTRAWLVASNLVREGRGSLVLTNVNAFLSTNASTSSRLESRSLNALDPTEYTTNGMLRIDGRPATFVVNVASHDFLRYLAVPGGGTGLMTAVYVPINSSGTYSFTNAPTDIVDVTNNDGTLTSDASVFALRTGVSINGPARTITNASGGIIFRASKTIQPRVIFGDGAEAVVYVASGNQGTLSGTLVGNNGLTTIGAGTLTLAAANPDLTGPVTINQGTLRLQVDNSLTASNAMWVGWGGTLAVAANATIGGLSGVGTVAAVAGTPTLTLADPTMATNVFAGTISGTLNLVKSGAGSQVLSGNHSLASLAINGGALVLDGQITSSSGVTVNGGVLAGNGTITGSVTFDGGALSPGNSAGAIYFIGDGTTALTLSSNTVVKLELQNGVAGVDYDQFVVTNGTFNLNDAELRLELIGPVTNGAEFVIVRNLQEDFSTLGQFRFGDTIVAEGATNGFGSAQLFTIQYGADFDQDEFYNDIVLTAVIPEPSAGMLVGAGLLVLLALRRRR